MTLVETSNSRLDTEQVIENIRLHNVATGMVVIKLEHVSWLIGYEKQSVIDVTHEHENSLIYSTSHMYAAKKWIFPPVALDRELSTHASRDVKKIKFCIWRKTVNTLEKNTAVQSKIPIRLFTFWVNELRKELFIRYTNPVHSILERSNSNK